MESKTLEEPAIYAVINRSSSSDSSMMADEVGQECSDEVMNFSYNELFPEHIMCTSTEKISCTESLSPKFIPRGPKLKLNLDIPENISDFDDTRENDHFIDNGINEKNIGTDPKESYYVLPTSEQLDALKFHPGKRSKIDMRKPIPFFIDNKLRHCKSEIRTRQFYYPDIILRSQTLKPTIDLRMDGALKPLNHISLPKVTIPDSDNIMTSNKFEVNLSMDESSIIHENSRLNDTSSLKLPWWRIPLAKCYELSSWLSNMIFQLMKTNVQRFSKSFVPTTQVYGTMKHANESNHNLAQLTSVIQAENERILLAFTAKLNYMTQELNKVHRLNETTLSILRSELDTLKTNTTKLVDNNDALTKDLIVLSKKLDETIQINSAIPSRLNGSAPIFQAPPPPPPPPPPLPLLPSSHSLPITPKSQNRSRFSRTPTKKCFTPLMEGRPLITVEDLLKVTLKKAPQTNKENHPKNNVQTPRGPVVSLDMLRSVKLKSTRRSRNNGETKNVRSPRRAFKGRGTQSFSLSPIMTGAVSPLSRILKQMDNRRGCNKALMSPTRSDNDLTKDNPKQFDVARPSKSSHTILV